MKERTERWLIRGGVLVLFLTLVSIAWVNRDMFAPLDSGTPAPDFAYPTLHGDTLSLAAMHGDVVLLNIWATWCPPCLREMPSMQRLHEFLGNDGLRVVAVSVDAPGATGAVRSFVHDLGLDFDILLNPSGGIQEAYGVNGLPTTFLIDREGRIRQRVLGASDWMSQENLKTVHALLQE